MSEPAPLVSCVVPVYNGARFLAEALESILAQTHRAVEVIAVDDGSTDATPEVLRGFGARVQVVRQQNQGPAGARNAGIARATGSFLAFLDADDLWHTDKLALQLDRFRQVPELMVSFATLRNVRAEPADTGDTADPLLDPTGWPVPPFSPCTFLGRREVFDQVGLFTPELRRGEDTEWFIRMMMKGARYEVISDVLVERRIHKANLTRGSRPGPLDVVEVLKLALDRRRREGW